MPKEPLRKAFREFFKPYRMKPCGIVRGRSALEDDLAKLLPGYVAEKFGVSKRAAQIRLEKLGGIVGKKALGCYALD